MRRVVGLVSVILFLAAAACGLTSGGGRAAGREQQTGPAKRVEAGAAQNALAVIVNRTNPVENLSFAELRQYFLGERTRWPNGRRVTIALRDSAQPEHDAVLRIIYGMREQDFHAHFLRAKFTGEALEEPRLLDTTSRLVNFVLLQAGAIGCVRAGELPPSVKVVSVDGRLPGDAEYRLKF